MSHLLVDQLQTALAERYLIDREIGRGGMATVYLARDPKHDRLVALKVLHPELAAALGPDRFLAEIRTTANLQHPHILPLHDSGEADGQLFYVMPFIEGETLRARLDRERQLSVPDAVRLAREVSSALDYAHRHGVIHRDIKPENILLHDGSALVADFGIALAVQSAGAGRMTQTGLSLGTPQYMSPEQAMGERTIDARSDVYSLGAVLYEMLTGDPPFTGSSVQAIVAKVMTERPTRPRVTRDTVPKHVEETVMTALAKLPADRYATAADFAIALQSDTGAVSNGDDVKVTNTSGAHRRWIWSSAVLGTATLAAVVFAVVTGLREENASSPAPVVRTHLELADGEVLLTGGYRFALSPLGDRLAYVSSGPAGIRTYVHRSDELTNREILVGSPHAYAFSPDGRWLALGTDTSLAKVSSDGGPIVPLAVMPVRIEGLAWRSPTEIVAGSGKGLWIIDAAGGMPRRIVSVDSTTPALSPTITDGGDVVVYAAGDNAAADLRAVSLPSGKPVKLGLTGSPVVVIDGYLIYSGSDGTLMAAKFDARKEKLIGEPIQLMDRVAAVAISPSGTLAYLLGQGPGQLVMVGGGGPDVPVMAEVRRYLGPRFSPDGRKIAVTVPPASSAVNEGDVYVYDLSARTFTQLSTDGPVNNAAEWSADGLRILYRHGGPTGRSAWWRPVDGSGPAVPLNRTVRQINESLISPDGKWFVYRTTPGGKQPRDIFAVPLTGDPLPLLGLAVGPAAAVMPRISADGRWLAYMSDESGRFEIYVQPFPGPGGRIQVTTDGGSEPLWARSGRSLIYRNGQSVISVAVSMSPSFTIGDRRTLVSGNYLTESTHQDYDISPDGTRLLMVKPIGTTGDAVIVHNWSRELRAKLAAEKN